MEASQEVTPPSSEDTTKQASPAPIEPTAKELAAAEEENLARAKAIIDRQQAQLQREVESAERPTLIEVAAQGMDALHAAVLANSQAKVPDYVPPPRTERQMSQLEAELAAGRKAQQRHEAAAKINAEARAREEAKDRLKEGYTTPVHRPADMVPHPLGGLKPIQQ